MKLNWFSKHTAHPSPPRSWLRVLGHSWSASPARRLVQAIFFLAFLALFFYAAWPHGAGEPAQVRARRELIDIELFLAVDPLVSISAAIAGRMLVWSLAFAGVILAISLLLPRFFCGYVCPMGTLVDLFDWAVSNRIKRLRIARPSWWRNLRYYILAAVLIAAGCGVMLGGYVAAIPTITRGFQFIASPLQIGFTRGWAQTPPVHAAEVLSILLLMLVLLLGLLRPRFWCRYVCPSGAVFSVFNFLRITDRKVRPHCVQCGKCAKACSFDAINDDFSTLGANCAFCQTCGGVCPVHAIEFRLRGVGAAAPVGAPAPAIDVSRRGFVVGATLGALGGGLAAGGVRTARARQLPAILRPPGSTPESLFARLCVRCGQCLRVCPTGLLRPSGLDQGLDRLWTPLADADLAACDPGCNNCGQVCPTGAIVAMTLEQKRAFHMGVAEVDDTTCIACRERTECQTQGGSSLICFDACEAARYSAIILQGDSNPIPTIDPDKCVGCGACQAACFQANVIDRKLLTRSAIRVLPAGSAQAQAARQPAAPEVPATTQPAKTAVPYFIPD